MMRNIRYLIGCVIICIFMALPSITVSASGSIKGDLENGSYEITKNTKDDYYTLTVYPDSNGLICENGKSKGWGSYNNIISKIVIADGTSVLGTVNATNTSADAILFSGFVNMESVELPETLYEIGDCVFSIDSVFTINLPKNLRKIGKKAFASSEIKEIVFPDSLVSIGEEAFASCQISSFHITKNLINIGDNALGCVYSSASTVSDISVDPENPKYMVKDKFLMTKDGKVLVRYFGPSKRDITSKELVDVTVPTGVEKIAAGAFYSVNCIKNIYLPDTLVEIGEKAFSHSDLSNGVLDFPDSLKTLGNNAFYSAKIQKIYMSSNLSEIGKSCFCFVQGLSYLYIPKGVKEIPENCFYLSEIKEVALPKNLERIGKYAFSNCKNLKEITIPYKVTSLPERAFLSCTSLETVTIEGKLSEIGESCFYLSNSIKDVYYGYKETQFKKLVYGYNSSLNLASFHEGIDVELYRVGSGSETASAEHVYYGDTLTITCKPKDGWVVKNIEVTEGHEVSPTTDPNVWTIKVGGGKLRITTNYAEGNFGIAYDKNGSVDFPKGTFTYKVGDTAEVLRYAAYDTCHDGVLSYEVHYIKNGIDYTINSKLITKTAVSVNGVSESLISYKPFTSADGVYEYYAVATTGSHGKIESGHTKIIVYKDFSILSNSGDVTIFEGANAQSAITVSGTNVSCKWTVDGKAADGTKNGNSFNISLDSLQVGTHTLVAEFTDARGEKLSETIKVTVKQSNGNQVPKKLMSSAKVNGYTSTDKIVFYISEMDELTLTYEWNEGASYGTKEPVVGNIVYYWDIYEITDEGTIDLNKMVKEINNKVSITPDDISELPQKKYAVWAGVDNELIVDGNKTLSASMVVFFIDTRPHEHVYTDSYSQFDDKQHYSYCACSKCILENHKWDDSLYEDSTSQKYGKRVCADCGYTEVIDKKVADDTEDGKKPEESKPAAKGDVLKTATDSYKVTVATSGKEAVEYTGSLSKTKTTVVVPDVVTINGVKYKVISIKANAFKNNKKLKKITIGKNISKIGKNAFYGCKNLKSIIIKTTKLTTKNVGKNAFAKINKKAKVKVPKKKLKAYKKLLKAKGIKAKTQKIVK